jgi:hypothetical protein
LRGTRTLSLKACNDLCDLEDGGVDVDGEGAGHVDVGVDRRAAVTERVAGVNCGTGTVSECVDAVVGVEDGAADGAMISDCVAVPAEGGAIRLRPPLLEVLAFSFAA